MNSIRTFQGLLKQYGKGQGCDICKPTVGSILATCWNEHILATDHVPLQDANDTFMANMQKNALTPSCHAFRAARLPLKS